MKQKVELKVRKIIQEELNLPMKKISPNASFVEHLGADSFDTAHILTGIKSELNIDITTEEASELHTVSDLAEHVVKKLKKQRRL